MHTTTGEIKPYSEVEKLSPKEQKNFVEIKRDLSEQEKNMRHIMLYSPCGCGSGKKFKFCCHAHFLGKKP